LARRDQSFEILVGDDSEGDLVENELNKEFEAESSIRCFHNVPALGQAANVDSLFKNANGRWIILLHDDDFLEPDALSIYREQIERYPEGDLFYGKQHLQDADGTTDLGRSEDFNRVFGRIGQNKGIVARPKEAVLLSQIPNNGFCVRADLARDPGYPGLPDSGDACDWAFGVRVAMADATFVFVDEYVSTYVLSPISVARTTQNDAAIKAMKLAELYFSDQKETAAYVKFFNDHLGYAVSQALEKNDHEYARYLTGLARRSNDVPRRAALTEVVKCFTARYFNYYW
jgi:glycosyltransferase involved in cell wall biosynthesis